MSNAGKEPGARWLRMLYRLESGLLALLLTAMIVLASGQILLRNLFSVGFFWIDPLLRVLVLWIGLLGALAASREPKHITIDVAVRNLSPRSRAAVQVLTGLFTTLVCGLVAWHGARFVAMEWGAGSRGFAGLPAWVLEVIIPLAFGLIALRYLLQALHQAQILVRGRDGLR